jgi:hypothetical protein
MGVLDFSFSRSRGLVRNVREGMAGSCVDLSSTVDSDEEMLLKTLGWRTEASRVLGVDLNRLVYNGTAGTLLSAGMSRRDVSETLAAGVLEQINLELHARSLQPKHPAKV